MDKLRLKAAILIISDTAFADPSTDKAGAILSDVFASDGDDQWFVDEIKIAPDDIESIQQAVKTFSDVENNINLLITTGGTGFTIKDRTPEAIHPLIHRYAPGLV